MIWSHLLKSLDFPCAQMVKNLHGMLCQGPGFDPWVGKTLWRMAWQPTPVFFPGESSWIEEPGRLHTVHGVLQVLAELDTTERLNTQHTAKIFEVPEK